MKDNKQNFKAYIINLDKDKNRMLFMHEQMQRLNIEYERISAVHGKEYDFGDECDSDLSTKANGKDITDGEKGCAKSHKLCYEKFLGIKNENKSDLEYALILEDDVELPFNFKDIIENQIKINNKKIRLEQNNSFEYLLFDYIKPGLFFTKHYINSLPIAHKNLYNSDNFGRIKFILKSIVKSLYIILISIFEGVRDFYYKKLNKNKPGKAVRFYRPLYLAGAYLVNKSGAEKIYSLTTPIIYPADRTPDEARKQKSMRFYAHSPLCVFQKREKFKSNIGL